MTVPKLGYIWNRKATNAYEITRRVSNHEKNILLNTEYKQKYEEQQKLKNLTEAYI
ncbi:MULTISPECIES: hypothetical protein [unclassified Rickettsia]|uniref:hypothetical protein n=1 Tax=unclassified Rickettsia TaxID=114295 RepID=UPI0012FDC951|nr:MULTISPECIES: hypothetical protein [unclassified Rickettsia]